ncbi:unnamed protein product [Orchesella dallaii]|uniref:Uncharacterized protein n=1 Tax=Orchesella dallaii TaxID=48710 RepID=A0ABP1PUZ8_9HEXA
MRIFLFATMLLLACVAIDGGLGLPVLIGGNGITIQKNDSVSPVKGNSLLNIIAPLTTPFLFLMNKLQKDLQMPSTQPDNIDERVSTVKGNSPLDVIAPWTTKFSFLMNKLQRNKQTPGTQRIDESDLSIQNARDALLNRQVDSHKRGKRAAYETWRHWFYSTIWPVFKGKRNFG